MFPNKTADRLVIWCLQSLIINHLIIPKVPKEECRDVPKQSCRSVPKQTCRAVPRQSCETVPEQECRVVPRQQCVNVPRQQCESVPKVAKIFFELTKKFITFVGGVPHCAPAAVRRRAQGSVPRGAAPAVRHCPRSEVS